MPPETAQGHIRAHNDDGTTDLPPAQFAHIDGLWRLLAESDTLTITNPHPEPWKIDILDIEIPGHGLLGLLIHPPAVIGAGGALQLRFPPPGFSVDHNPARGFISP